MTESINASIPALDVGKLRMGACALHAALAPGVLILAPGDLTRQHLGRKVRFQRITDDGLAKVIAVLESVQFDGDGYRLVLDSGTTSWGPYDDGATVQFLKGGQP